jgi:hypothetical protein
LVDKLKNEQKLFTKDMIRINDRITKAEKNLTPVAKKRIEEAASQAVKKGEKEIVKEAQEAGFTQEESKNAEKIKKETESENKKVKEELNKKGQKATEEVEEIEKSLKTYRKDMEKYLRNFLKPIKNQIMAGFAVGFLEEMSREVTGLEVPRWAKTTFYGVTGIPLGRGGRYYIPMRLAGGLASWFTHSIRKNYYKNALNSRRGRDRRIYYDAIKKKGFTQKELKEIKSS